MAKFLYTLNFFVFFKGYKYPNIRSVYLEPFNIYTFSQVKPLTLLEITFMPT